MQTLKSEEFWPAGDAIAAHKSSWQLLARSFSLGLGFFGLAFAYLSFGSRASEGAQISYWILGALMLVNAAAIAWHCRWKSISSLQSGLSFCDALLITTTIYLSGGPQSPILFIYLPLVMAASVQFSQRDGLIMAGVCGLAYSVLAWCLVHGIIPSADESLITSAPTGGLILQIVGLCSAMVLIAVAGSFLS
ncbi:MAG: hypothetical protein DCC75_07425, partial [Proteobacteria bacterium]